MTTAAASGGPPVAEDHLVSVVMAARDAAGTIGTAIASVLAQTWPALELIVVDDGSRDGTPGVVAGAAAADLRVRPVRLEGGGVAPARNRGIARARGRWLLFCDADDTVDRHHLEHLIAAARASGARLIRSSWRLVDAAGTPGRVIRAEPVDDLFAYSAPWPAFRTSELLMRTADVREIGGFDPGLVWGEDWDLWTRLGRLVPGCVAAPAAVAHYHLRPRRAHEPFDRWLEDGLRVLDRAFRPDPRLPPEAPGARRTLPAAGLAAARSRLILSNLGIRISAGAPIIDDAFLDQAAAAALPLEEVARCILSGLSFGAGREGVALIWDRLRPRIEPALPAVCRHSGQGAAPGDLLRAIGCAIADEAPSTALPLVAAPVLAARVTLADRPRPISVPVGVDTLRLYLAGSDGQRGWPVMLPVSAPEASPTAIAEAVRAAVRGREIRRFTRASRRRRLQLLLRLAREALGRRGGAARRLLLRRGGGRKERLEAWLEARVTTFVPLCASSDPTVSGRSRLVTPDAP